MEIDKPGWEETRGGTYIIFGENSLRFATNKTCFLFYSLRTAILNTIKKLLAFTSYTFFIACRVLWKVVTRRFLNGRNNVDFCIKVVNMVYIKENLETQKKISVLEI